MKLGIAYSNTVAQAFNVSCFAVILCCLQQHKIVTQAINTRCFVETWYCLQQYQVVSMDDFAVAAVAQQGCDLAAGVSRDALGFI